MPPPSSSTSIAGRARVERVLDQLLDDGRRPLDDLAGGDPVDDVAREPVDLRQRQLLLVDDPAAGDRPEDLDLLEI